MKKRDITGFLEQVQKRRDAGENIRNILKSLNTHPSTYYGYLKRYKPNRSGGIKIKKIDLEELAHPITSRANIRVMIMEGDAKQIGEALGNFFGSSPGGDN